ncbi:MAG: acetylglutamate kinase [Gemmatimonadota bacterium]
MLQVIKAGGAALNDASWLDQFADAAAQGTNERVIVHGGGPDITALSAQLGIAVEFHSGGRRITSEAALDVTSMVLNGRINKRIVRVLRSRGLDAFGLSGEDGGVIVGKLVEGGSLGRVGEVISVRSSLLKALIEAQMLPVVSPVSIATDFGALNINADEVAAAIAQKLEADELLFLTDVAGVRQHDAYLATLSVPAAQQLIDSGVATGGMALKLRAAIAALKFGVTKVRVGPLEMLSNVNAGTAIYAEEVACR